MCCVAGSSPEQTHARTHAPARTTSRTRRPLLLSVLLDHCCLHMHLRPRTAHAHTRTTHVTHACLLLAASRSFIPRNHFGRENRERKLWSCVQRHTEVLHLCCMRTLRARCDHAHAHNAARTQAQKYDDLSLLLFPSPFLTHADKEVAV